MNRLCPACSTRYTQLIDPECVICDGAGILRLAPAALSLYDAAIVSQAVHLALEAAARTVDTTTTLTDDRVPPVRAAVQQLVTAGLLVAINYRPRPLPVTRLPRKRTAAGQYAFEATPEQLAAQYAGADILPLDEALASAPPFTYTEDDRPHARGLPVLSANWHPSHLARLADPAEPGTNTMLECRGRARDTQHAHALQQAVPEAARLRSRRKKTA